MPPVLRIVPALLKMNPVPPNCGKDKASSRVNSVRAAASWIGSQVRKRTGQQPGEAFLDKLLPDFPLVANLDNPRYVDLLLDGCASLTGRLSRLDQDTVDSTLARLRSPSTGIARPLRVRLREADAPLRIALFILRAVA